MNHYRFTELLTGKWIDGIIVAFAALAWGSTALQLARGLSNPEPPIQIAAFILGLAGFSVLTVLAKKWGGRFSWQFPLAEKYQPISILLLGVALRIR